MLHITLFGNRKNAKSEGVEIVRESESADNLSLSIARRHQKTKQSSALVVVGFRTAAAKKILRF